METKFSQVETAFLKKAGDYDMTTRTPYILVENFPKLGLMTALRFLEWVLENPEGVISLPTGKTPEFFIKYTDFLLENWNKAPAPVWNPQHGKNSWLQNFSFDYSGLHFVAADWSSRAGAGLEGEQADLHDFTGGTLPWFTSDLENCPKDFGENIVMLSHHPMHVTPLIQDMEVASFSREEVNVIETLTASYGDNVYADIAGHYHVQWQETRAAGRYELFVTEAIHVAAKSFRLVRVYSDGASFSYDHSKILVAP